MSRGKGSLRDSQAPSPDGSEDDEARSPISGDEREAPITVTLTPPAGFARGRKGKSDTEEQKRDALDVLH